MKIQLPSKGFWVKFILFDLVFCLTFYLTIIYTFPVSTIIKANRKQLNQTLGKEIRFKSAKLDPWLNIVFQNVRIKGIETALLSRREKPLLELYREIERVVAGAKEGEIKDIEAYTKQKGIDLNKLALKKRADLRLFKKDWKKYQQINEAKPLKIKKLLIQPDLSATISGKPKLSFEATLLDGALSGEYEAIPGKVRKSSRNSRGKRGRRSSKKPKNSHKISLEFDQISGKKLSGMLALRLPLTGRIAGHLGLTMDPRFKDISDLNFDLSLDDGKIGPGPMYIKKMRGDLTLPSIAMGSFTLAGSSKGKRIVLQPLKIRSADLEAELDGYISTGTKMRPNMKLKYKLTEAFLNNPDNKKIAMAIRGMSSAKRKDGFFGYLIVGTLDKLKFKKYKR